MKNTLKTILRKLKLLHPLRELENSFRRRLLPLQNRLHQASIKSPALDGGFAKGNGDLPYDNIFLIVVDCLRTDHLSFAGYPRETTPFLDQIAQNGTTSSHHYTACSWTYPSVISMMTGLYPNHHGGVLPHQTKRRFYHDKNNIPHQPHSHLLFLTDYLEEVGFKTFSYNAVLTAALSMKGHAEQLRSRDLDADEVFKWVTNKISQNDQPKFFHLQLWDLHEPLEILERDFRPFGKIEYADKEKLKRWQYQFGRDLDTSAFKKYKENRILLYDTALRFVDQQIKIFYEWLDKNRLLEKSLIIITSDHGEEFWEHVEEEKKWQADPRNFYGIGHGHTMFEELIHIPLIIFPKKLNLGGQLTSSVDLAPTVLKLLNLKASANFNGTPLSQLPQEPRTVFAEETGYGMEMKIARRENLKAYYFPTENQLYTTDLNQDPKEKNLKPSNGASNLEKQLLQFSKPAQETENSGKIGDEDKIRERLKDLGYI